VKTYSVARAVVATDAPRSYGVLWLDRLDKLNVEEQRLGWRKRGMPYGVVILDVIRDDWSRDFWQPALLGEQEPRAGLLALLRSDGLSGTEAESLVTQAMTCRDDRPLFQEDQDDDSSDDDRPAAPAISDASSPCALQRKELQDRSVRVLAKQVEGHELQHQIDGDEIAVPDLVWMVVGDEGTAAQQVTAELSAYLAEIVRAPVPYLALAHFGRMAARPETSAGWAWRVAEPLLADDGGNLNDDAVRERAQRAHVAAFGVPVAVTK
jgi:hypothetical protein